ncbi:DsrE family protein [Ahniella affigens]|uniref:DsrE family protein n=1 Tax=Ahniella affigens TaxID=2021234 RepID=UPI001475C9E1|nr:DsrE family protein [Ahniella affigens]
MNRAGLFVQRGPDAGFVPALIAACADLHQSAGPLRVLFLYGDAARAADLLQVAAADRAAYAALLQACRDAGGSTLVCQTALEKLGIAVSPELPLSVGSLGQWFDLLHDLDAVASLSP